MTNDNSFEILRRSLVKDTQELLRAPEFMQEQRLGTLNQEDIQALHTRIFKAFDGNPQQDDKRLELMHQSYRRLLSETPYPDRVKDLTDKMHKLVDAYIDAYGKEAQSRKQAAKEIAVNKNLYVVRDGDTLDRIVSEWLTLNIDSPGIDGQPLPINPDRRPPIVVGWIRKNNVLKDADGAVYGDNATAPLLAGQTLELPPGERIDQSNALNPNESRCLLAMLHAYHCIQRLQPPDNREGNQLNAELESNSRRTLLSTMEFVRQTLLDALRQQATAQPTKTVSEMHTKGMAHPVAPAPAPTPKPTSGVAQYEKGYNSKNAVNAEIRVNPWSGVRNR